MAVRDDRSDVKQTTAGFRGPLMVQSLTSAKSKFLSLSHFSYFFFNITARRKRFILPQLDQKYKPKDSHWL